MKNPTIAQIKRLVQKSNPDVAGLHVAWCKRPKVLVNETTGYKWISAKVFVSGEGFRSGVMTVSRDHDSLMVR